MSEKSKKEFIWRVKPYKTLTVLSPLLRGIARILFSVRVAGRENLPKQCGGVILACNHLHAIDPAFLAAFSRMNFRFMAKVELYKNPMVSFLLRHANSFPVDRDIIDRKSLDFALEVMKDGRCGLGIFPEGTRSPDGKPAEGKTGIAMLARKTKADILPCSLYHEGSLKFRRKITLRFGEVIPFEALGLGETPNKRQNREATDKIMAAVTALWEEGDG